MIRAFKTKAIGTTSIVFSQSAGRARYVTFRGANDAGYKITFADIKVNRSPEYDIMESKSKYFGIGANRCYKPEDLKQLTL